jgi:hypothetical protein
MIGGPGMPSRAIVHVLHPAPVDLRRKRARNRQIRFIIQETPIALRHVHPVDLGEALDAPTWPDRPRLTWHAFEGALWYRLRGVSLDPSRKGPWDSFGPTEFEAFLRRQDLWQQIGHTDLGKAFYRTPLIASGIYAEGPTRGLRWGGHGIGGNEYPIAEIFSDGRDAASPTLSAFMDRSVIVAGDAVLVRTSDPLLKLGPRGPVLQPFPRTNAPFENRQYDVRLGYRLDRFEAGVRWALGPEERITPHLLRLEPWLESMAKVPSGPDTAVLLANFVASAAHIACDAVCRPRAGYIPVAADEEVEAFLSASSGIEDWAVKASMGAIMEAEAPSAIACSRRAIQAVSAIYLSGGGRPPQTVREAEELLVRFDEFEWPIAYSADLPQDDVASLSTLAM